MCLFKVVFNLITFGKNTNNTLSVIDMILCHFQNRLMDEINGGINNATFQG